MEPITLIGDCHAFRVQLSHHRIGISEIPFMAWGKGGLKAWTFEPELRMGPNWLDEEGKEYSQVKDEGVVIIWLGYNDIKAALPAHKDAYVTAEKLVATVKSNFKNSKIIIVEPLMQFKECIMAFPGELDYFTFEERLEQNELFITHLRYLCNINNFNYLDQNHIANAIGTTELDLSLTEDISHPSDGLKNHYYDKIYGLFVNEALKLQKSID